VPSEDSTEPVPSASVQSASTTPGPAEPVDREDASFEFLCPNGHKLRGKSSLQGRPGQCPHCNARFLIPDPADDGDVEAPTLADDEQIGINVGHGVEEEGESDTADAVVFSIHDEPPPAPTTASCHPLSQIIRKLWAATRGTGVLQLLLDDGATLTVESLSVELSQHDYAVFTVPGETQTHVVTILPWNRIQQATLSELTELPSDLFLSPRPTRCRPDRAR
jgi:hypothetical protein